MTQFIWNTTHLGARRPQINTYIHYLNDSGNDDLRVCILLKLWIQIPVSITKTMDLQFLAGPLKDFFVCIYMATYLLGNVCALMDECERRKGTKSHHSRDIILWLDAGYAYLIARVTNRVYFYQLKTLFQKNSEKVLYMKFVLMLEILFIWLLSLLNKVLMFKMLKNHSLNWTSPDRSTWKNVFKLGASLYSWLYSS